MADAYTYEQVEAEALADLRAGHFAIPATRSPSPLELRWGPSVRGFPEDPGGVSDEELSRWQASLAAWLAYAEAQASVALAVMVKAEQQQAALRAQVFARTEGKVHDRRAVADSDPDVVAAGAVVAQAKARHALCEGQVKGIRPHAMAVAQVIKDRTERPGRGERQQDGRR